MEEIYQRLNATAAGVAVMPQLFVGLEESHCLEPPEPGPIDCEHRILLTHPSFEPMFGAVLVSAMLDKPLSDREMICRIS